MADVPSDVRTVEDLFCRGCKKKLILPENMSIADCCPCNSPWGINHGIVPAIACTCDVCDPAQTGSSRWQPPEVPRRTWHEVLMEDDEGGDR